nr:DUF3093 family protein [Auraticoccus cholistanensis]
MTVPWLWVLLAAGVVASLVLTCLVVTPGWVTVVVTVLSTSVTAVLLWQHSAPVVADEHGLRAGRARVEWDWVASARVLTAEEVQDRLRGRADVGCWRLQRPYLDRLVRVELSDPADPHPAWLVATRRPEALVETIRHHLSTTRAGAPA